MSKVEEIVVIFVVLCDDKASVAAAKYVTYGEGCSISVTHFLKFRGGNIITCAQKTENLLSC